ncbi:hypothetical protein BAE44_0021889 [Dichanthelium oligosanthes]|uniref:Uncharacterized protein n=1 Tax=Dichanthelium oligosanthes TaxID=888268 RepID=A0A1E5UVX9_9POAL|nr:hypothetical protein BAE44_0021889 [Dichanthelium oligosanthes]
MHVCGTGEDHQRKTSPMALCQRMTPKHLNTSKSTRTKGPMKFSDCRNVHNLSKHLGTNSFIPGISPLYASASAKILVLNMQRKD